MAFSQGSHNMYEPFTLAKTNLVSPPKHHHAGAVLLPTLSSYLLVSCRCYEAES
jgi:hypothetical protein